MSCGRGRSLANRRGNSRGFRRNTIGPAGSRKGLCRPSSRNAGPAVDGWRAAGAEGEGKMKRYGVNATETDGNGELQESRGGTLRIFLLALVASALLDWLILSASG